MAIQTILVIEDDRFIGEMYVRSLRKAGYTVDWLIDGVDGLVAARNNHYDLILLDIMLPEKRGSEILEALRAEPQHIAGTKIVIMTNFDQDESTRLALQTSVDGYLIKAEITPRRLLEIIAGMKKS
jgi:response regulator receiver protein